MALVQFYFLGGGVTTNAWAQLRASMFVFVLASRIRPAGRKNCRCWVRADKSLNQNANQSHASLRRYLRPTPEKLRCEIL